MDTPLFLSPPTLRGRRPGRRSGTALFVLALLAAMTAPPSLEAQHAHGEHDAENPYADLLQREIAALSAEEMEDLREGRGMGLALAAELNGVPGPLHVLELAEGLGLTADQRTGVERIFREMRERAQELGAQILELERELDMRFRHGHADPGVVRELTGRIGALEGELRAVHLNAHLELADGVLTERQIHEYRRLRGYGEDEGG